MPVNVGTLDRVLRVLVGVALIAFAIPIGFPDPGWNWIGWLGVIPLITACAWLSIGQRMSDSESPGVKPVPVT